MSSFWSRNISLSIFGESHGPAIGVVIDNLPPGEYIDLEKLRQFMARRAPKKDGTTTPRGEKDLPQIMSGLLNDRTTGVPLCAFIQNTDTRSKDYSNLARLPRPGHADYTGAMRYRGFNDVRGGGHFSGRLTAPLCFAGAVCGQILERRGIYTGAHIASIHGIQDDAFSRTKVTKEDILEVREKDFPVRNDAQGEKMKEDIRNASHGGESLGGISSGMPITLNVAIKPTASIAKPQETVDFRAKTNEMLQIQGRHDPCIVPRAVPCVEAAVNIALLSHMMDYPHF